MSPTTLLLARSARIAQPGDISRPVVTGIAVGVTVLVLAIISVIVWFLFVRDRFRRGTREIDAEEMARLEEERLERNRLRAEKETFGEGYEGTKTG